MLEKPFELLKFLYPTLPSNKFLPLTRIKKESFICSRVFLFIKFPKKKRKKKGLNLTFVIKLTTFSMQNLYFLDFYQMKFLWYKIQIHIKSTTTSIPPLVWLFFRSDCWFHPPIFCLKIVSHFLSQRIAA